MSDCHQLFKEFFIAIIGSGLGQSSVQKDSHFHTILHLLDFGLFNLHVCQ